MESAVTSIVQDEVRQFAAQAREWWDPNGPEAMLHKLNPVRLKYIRDQIDQHWQCDECSRHPLEGKTALDVGCGAGLLAEPLARLGANVTGLDASADLIAVAQEHARARGLAIDYRAGDYLDQQGPFDFIISSQVTHHMTDGQLQTFLRHMEAEARMGWLICDLHRHGYAHWGFPILARLMMVHRIVREDGTLSIARSFRPAEWEALLAEAGIPKGAARIVRRFPFRLCVERVR